MTLSKLYDMKANKMTKVGTSIWGLVMLILSNVVAPMPTTNRWLTKMGESTSNLSCYGLDKSNLSPKEMSLSMYSE